MPTKTNISADDYTVVFVIGDEIYDDMPLLN